MSPSLREQHRREILARTPRGPAPPDAAVPQDRAVHATALEMQLVVHGMHVADARRASALLRSPAPDERLRHCLVLQAPDRWRLLLDVNATTRDGQSTLHALRRRGAKVVPLLQLLRERGWPHRLAA